MFAFLSDEGQFGRYPAKPNRNITSGLPTIPPESRMTLTACCHRNALNSTRDHLSSKWLNCSAVLRRSPEVEDGRRALLYYSWFEDHRLWAAGICYHNFSRRHLQCPARQQS